MKTRQRWCTFMAQPFAKALMALHKGEELPADKHMSLCRLVKAGVIPQQYARRFNLISAWAEMVGYVGSIWLNVLRIAAAVERERALSEELLRRKKVQHHIP